MYSVTNLAPAASCYTCNHWRKVWGGEGTPAPQLFEKILCIYFNFVISFVDCNRLIIHKYVLELVTV